MLIMNHQNLIFSYRRLDRRGSARFWRCKFFLKASSNVTFQTRRDVVGEPGINEASDEEALHTGRGVGREEVESQWSLLQQGGHDDCSAQVLQGLFYITTKQTLSHDNVT